MECYHCHGQSAIRQIDIGVVKCSINYLILIRDAITIGHARVLPYVHHSRLNTTLYIDLLSESILGRLSVIH
jgi:hypothetical protein